VDETTSLLTGDAAPREELCLLISTASGVRVERLDRAATHVLGRGGNSTLLVLDPSVSREHAKIVTGEHAALVDLGSRNGSKVDGVRAPPNEPVPLRVGSTIELGSTTLILQRAAGFVDAQAAAPAPPTRGRDADGPVVRDSAMARLYGLLDVVAPSPLAVLILGETGVGKEVFAEELHKRSHRRDSPFLKLNCAALPESLLEGELFGYVLTGEVLRASGKTDAAVAAFQEALGARDSWLGHYGLGRAYLDAGVYAKADAEFSLCLKQRGRAANYYLPSAHLIPPAVYYRGRAQEGMGSAEAKATYAQFLAMEPEAQDDRLAQDARRRLAR
jgi:hypothetical protein